MVIHRYTETYEMYSEKVKNKIHPSNKICIKHNVCTVVRTVDIGL